VLAEHHVRYADLAQQPVVQHRPRARADLFGGLEDRDHRALPVIAACGERRDGAAQPGHVHVVPARVHHVRALATRVGRHHVAGVVQPRLLAHRQRVHVGAQQHRRAVPIAQHARHAGPADPGADREPGRVQPLRGDPRRPVLGERQLGMSVQVLV